MNVSFHNALVGLVILAVLAACSASSDSVAPDTSGTPQATSAPEATATPDRGPTVELAGCLSGQALESEGMVDLDADGFGSEWQAVASVFTADTEPAEERSSSDTSDDVVTWSVRSAAGDFVGVVELVLGTSGGWIVQYSATCVDA